MNAQVYRIILPKFSISSFSRTTVLYVKAPWELRGGLSAPRQGNLATQTVFFVWQQNDIFHLHTVVLMTAKLYSNYPKQMRSLPTDLIAQLHPTIAWHQVHLQVKWAAAAASFHKAGEGWSVFLWQKALRMVGKPAQNNQCHLFVLTLSTMVCRKCGLVVWNRFRLCYGLFLYEELT